MPHYFAYGSNMNPQRVASRGLAVIDARPAWLQGMALRFNKRSRHNPEWACANISWSPDAVVEGVLYRLADEQQILKMDPFEGAPVYYSREYFMVETADAGTVPAWTYVANPAVVDNSVLPLRWYLGQLLEGRPFLSATYVKWLEATRCHADDSQGWS